MNQLLRPNQQIFTETSRSAIRVEQFLGGGGQGEVYRASFAGKAVALKWYFPRTATWQQRALLEDLVKRPPPNERFLWPLEVVSAPDQPGYGYVMGLRAADFRGIVDLMKRRIDPSYHALLTAGYQLADSYFQLHAAGLCYRDISFGNVFFDPGSGDVLICDNDNVAVNRALEAGVLGTPRFMAPEVVRGDALPSSDTDLYSLAVLLFYMLCVHHPLEGLRETQVRCLDLPAMNRLYGERPVFIFDPEDSSNRPDPEHQKNALEMWPVLPRELQDLFTQSFTLGIRDPQHGRVRETKWRQALLRARDALAYCSECGTENFFDDQTPDEERPCWSCRQPCRWPPRLRLNQRHLVVLRHDLRLYPHHLDPERSNDLSQIYAEVSRHPRNPQVWGLKNRSPVKWVATNPQGAVCDVPPEKSVPLAPGTRLNFGNITGEILI